MEKELDLKTYPNNNHNRYKRTEDQKKIIFKHGCEQFFVKMNIA